MTDLTKRKFSTDSGGKQSTAYDEKLRDLGDGTHGEVVTAVGFTVNPTSVLTRPADTTAYTALDLIASSTTAGSVVVPSVTVARVTAGGITIPKIALYSNHTTGLASVSVTIRLWSAAPTYSAGDNAAYAVATGAASCLGKFTGIFEQFADGAVAFLVPDTGVVSMLKLASGQLIYWDLQTNSGFSSQSGKTFTAVPQVAQD